MTRQNLTHILIGLMFCFCFFSKQAAQSYDFAIEPPSIQDVVAESVDVDDVVESGDDLMLFPSIFATTFFLLLSSAYLSLRYSQPIVPTPQRPPSF